MAKMIILEAEGHAPKNSHASRMSPTTCLPPVDSTAQADLVAGVQEKLQLAICTVLGLWSSAGLGGEGRVFELVDLIILVHAPVVRS